MTAEVTETTPTATPTTVTAPCPAPDAGEDVFAVGGGYETGQVALTMFATSNAASDGNDGWDVTFVNAAADQDATVSVICAYVTSE